MARIATILEALLALLAAILSLACAVLASDPTTFGLNLFATGILAMGGFGLAVIARLVFAFCNPRGQRLHALLGRRIVLLLPAALIVVSAVLIESDAPFQARFAWSRAALESAARNARRIERRGDDDARWIGLFRIHGMETDTQGRAHFDLGGCGFLDQCELVFDPAHSDSPVPRHGKSIDEHWWILAHPF